LKFLIITNTWPGFFNPPAAHLKGVVSCKTSSLPLIILGAGIKAATAGVLEHRTSRIGIEAAYVELA
jgi:hypothetical protein